MFISCITYSFYSDPDNGVYGQIFWLKVILLLISSKSNDYISHLDSEQGLKKFLPFRDWNLVAHKQIVADMIEYAEYIKRARTEAQWVKRRLGLKILCF